MDFDALMQKKLGGKYLKPGMGETEDSVQDVSLPKKTTQSKKKATLKPRVMCSQCDFISVDGKEMEMHRKKHEKTFDCTECTFVANYMVVLRRHQINKHNKKWLSFNSLELLVTLSAKFEPFWSITFEIRPACVSSSFPDM